MPASNEYIIQKIEELALEMERMHHILSVYTEECVEIVCQWYDFISDLYSKMPIYWESGSETNYLHDKLEKIRNILNDIWIDEMTGYMTIPLVHTQLDKLIQLCRT